MDFSDLSSYPIVANPDYSPSMDSFTYPDTYDKAYLADAYTTQPDYTFDSFFDQPVSSIELSSSGYPSKTQSTFNPSIQNPTRQWPSSANSNTAAPFGRIDQFSNNFFDPSNTTPFDSTCFDSSRRNSSPTPSLCGDAPQQPIQQQPQPQLQNLQTSATPVLKQESQASPSLSPLSLKRESPSSPPFTPSEPQKRPQRKRGRPRLERQYSDSSNSTANCIAKTNRPTHRLPHNQVERKYREGLNSELERLRRAVPTLPQGDEGQVLGQPKPSKAMVLAGAIEYIKRLERERDEANRECERLRRNNGRSNQWDGEWDPRSGFEDQFIASDVY